MIETTVKINKSVLDEVKKFRKKPAKAIRYTSDKQFVNIAVIELLKKEGVKVDE